MRFIIDTLRLLVGAVAFAVLFFVGIPFVTTFMALLGIAVAWTWAWDAAKTMVPVKIPPTSRAVVVTIAIVTGSLVVQCLIEDDPRPATPRSDLLCTGGAHAILVDGRAVGCQR